MADVIARHSALAGLLEPGRVGTGSGDAGVTISECRDALQLQLIARNGQAGALASEVKRHLRRKQALSPLEGAERDGLFICATGPHEYWAVADPRDAAKSVKALEKIAKGRASIFDQSDGRFLVHLSGPKAVDALAKGTSLDLGGAALPGECGVGTTIEHIPALISRRWLQGAAMYEVSVPRSYAGSFMTWLEEATREYGAIAEGD